jgi:hypothetical protein
MKLVARRLTPKSIKSIFFLMLYQKLDCKVYILLLKNDFQEELSKCTKWNVNACVYAM